MKELLMAILPNCEENKCMKSANAALIAVIDDVYQTSNQPAYIEPINSVEEDEWHFLLENLQQKEIYFVALDNCVFTTADIGQKRCDFLAFDEKEILFVDIKKTSSGGRKQAKKKAAEQLKSTWNFLKDKVDFGAYNVILIVGLVKREPYPRKNCSNQNLVEEFLQEFGIPLSESNRHSFE
jgi:hypothetical protein